MNFIENYFGLLKVLLGKDVAMDSEFVWKHFGEPDDWDPITALVHISPNRELQDVQAKDMFSFISSI